MRRLLFQQEVLLAALAVVLVIFSLLPGHWAHAISSRPRHIVESVRAPFASPLHSVAESVRRSPDKPVDLVYGSDLDTQYKAMLRQNRALEQEVARLKRELEIYEGARRRGATSMNYLVARVTGVSMRPDTSRTITIDVGTMDGVFTNMVVTSDQFNLVGRVIDAGPKAATVELIISAGTNLSVEITAPVPPEEAMRRHPALLKTAKDGKTLYDTASQDDEVQSGDLAHLADTKWPPEASGYVVGKVTAVEVDPENALLRRIIVEPIRSLAHLSHVVVLQPHESTSGMQGEPEGAGR